MSIQGNLGSQWFGHDQNVSSHSRIRNNELVWLTHCCCNSSDCAPWVHHSGFCHGWGRF